MELILQKLTEVGVDEIILVSTKRSVVKVDDKKEGKKIERWERIMYEAAKQSKRGKIPKLRGILSFKEALEDMKNNDMNICPYENERTVSIKSAIEEATTDAVSVLSILGPNDTTLECKVNQYETEAMLELFEKEGYEKAETEDYADVYVINTCTVTHMSDRKSRQYIRRMKKKNPDAIIAVVGCYSQVSPGNPTITSVVIDTFGIAALSLSTIALYSSVVYLRFILFKVSSHPLCNDKWQCGQTLSIVETASTNSSVNNIGSTELSLILSIPSISFICFITSRSFISLSFMSFP